MTKLEPDELKAEEYEDYFDAGGGWDDQDDDAPLIEPKVDILEEEEAEVGRNLSDLEAECESGPDTKAEEEEDEDGKE